MSIRDNESHLVHDLKCSRKDACSMCQLADIVFFKMRGISSNLMEIMDVEYIIETKNLLEDENGLTWRGMSKSEIVFDSNLTRWKVASIQSCTTIIVLDLKVFRIFKTDTVIYSITRKTCLQESILG